MIRKSLAWFTNLYGVWVIGVSVWAFFQPAILTWFTGPWVTWSLSLVMLSMGLTLHTRDFRKIAEKPHAVAVGFVAQYTIMPATAYAIGVMLGLPPVLAAGLILVGCCPGGMASNVVTYLARANVALSLVMTMVSTLLAAVMTPMLTQFLAGHYVPVDGWGIFLSTLRVVIIPVLIGLFINTRYPEISARVNVVGPAIAVLAIVMIAGAMVARNVDVIREEGLTLALAGFLLHTIGFVVGYWLARALRLSQQMSRTVSIEVGMQNSGLAMVLAHKHFSPEAASPAVFSSIFHTLVGSLCAMYWRMKPETDGSQSGNGNGNGTDSTKA